MSLSFTITLNKPIYKNIDVLYFIENNNNIYYDETHMNYIYNHKIDNIDYIFNGFFKDDYFVIISDSYNNNLLVNIELKYIIILKLKWKIDDIKKHNIFVIDTNNMINYKTDAFLLKNRKIINNLSIYSINDYLNLNHYSIVPVIINSNKITKTKLINKIKKVLSIV